MSSAEAAIGSEEAAQVRSGQARRGRLCEERGGQRDGVSGNKAKA